MAAGGALPTRFCPACYRRNPWEAERCGQCGAQLEVDDDLEARLIWALDHPNTEVAIRAAAAIAERRTAGAVGALRRALASGEVYRAAAAAQALVAFDADPAALSAVERAKRHPSIVVRRAVQRTLAARGRARALNHLIADAVGLRLSRPVPSKPTSPIQPPKGPHS